MELTRFRESLRQDNYLFLGTDSFDNADSLISTLLDRDCMKAVNRHRTQQKLKDDDNPPQCWQDFLTRLQGYRNRNQNLIISEEWFSIQFGTYQEVGRTALDWIALQEALRDWNVIVVVGYRRLFDILPSAKQQWDRWYSNIKALNAWPPKGRSLEPLFPNVLDDPHLKDDYVPQKTGMQGVKQWSYTDYLTESIGPYFPIKILNMHRGFVRTNFMCEILPNAMRTCAYSRSTDQQEPESKANQEQSLFYDALVTKAAEKGLIDTEKHDRHRTTVKLEEYYEKYLGRSPKDLEQICPPEDQLNYLLERSIAKEKKLMPHLSEEAHRQAFEEAKKKKKFCWVDTDRALMRPELKQFFASLPQGSSNSDARRAPVAPPLQAASSSQFDPRLQPRMGAGQLDVRRLPMGGAHPLVHPGW